MSAVGHAMQTKCMVCLVSAARVRARKFCRAGIRAGRLVERLVVAARLHKPLHSLAGTSCQVFPAIRSTRNTGACFHARLFWWFSSSFFPFFPKLFANFLGFRVVVMGVRKPVGPGPVGKGVTLSVRGAVGVAPRGLPQRLR